jgi:hypothetical protein
MSSVMYGKILGPDHVPQSVGWLLDRMVPNSGLTGIHGAPRSGRTSLVVQTITALRTGSGLFGRRITRPVERVSIFAANDWAANRYYDQFKADAGVQVATFSVRSVTDPAAWAFARNASEDHSAELVVFDTLPQCLPEQVTGLKAELDRIGVPVLGVFIGAASTQSVRPDDWRSELTAGVHLRSEKGVTSALNLYSQMSSPVEIKVAWQEESRGFLGLDADDRPIVDPTPLSVDQVRELGTRARWLSNKSGGPQTLAEKLLADDYDAVGRICGQDVRVADLASAIETHGQAWTEGLALERSVSALPEEAPF